MKKNGILLVLLLAVLSLCLFTACGKGDEELTTAVTADENTASTTAATTTATTAAATTYRVTFTGKNVTEPAQMIEEGGFAERPEDPVREGFTFEGWYIGQESLGQELFDFESVIVEDITLTAKWTTDSFTVTFYGKDNSTVLQTGKIQYNFKANAPVLSLSDTEVLLGWCTEKNGEGTGFDASAAVKADATYYPHVVEGVTIRFFDENRETLLKVEKLVAGTKAEAPNAPDKSVDNKDFKGFFDKDGNAYNPKVAYSASASFFAEYTQYYQVKFMVDAIQQSNLRIALGATVTPPSVPETDSEGRIFKGWMDEKNNAWTATTAVLANTVYTAVYKAQYTVNFVLPDGSPVMRSGEAYTLKVFEGETASMPVYTDALYAEYYYLLPSADALYNITSNKTVTLTPVDKSSYTTRSVYIKKDDVDCGNYIGTNTQANWYPAGCVMNSEGDYYAMTGNFAGPVSVYAAITNHTEEGSDDKFTVRIYVDDVVVNEYTLSYGQTISQSGTTVCTLDALEAGETVHTIKVELYRIESEKAMEIDGVVTCADDSGKEDVWGGIISTAAVLQEYNGD